MKANKVEAMDSGVVIKAKKAFNALYELMDAVTKCDDKTRMSFADHINFDIQSACGMLERFWKDQKI